MGPGEGQAKVEGQERGQPRDSVQRALGAMSEMESEVRQAYQIDLALAPSDKNLHPSPAQRPCIHPRPPSHQAQAGALRSWR